MWWRGKSNIGPKDRQKVFQALEKYCELDTRAMVDIMDALKKVGDMQ